MSIRSRVLNKLFGLLYGPLVFLHEPAGACLFGPSWAGRRSSVGHTIPDKGLVLDLGCGGGLLLSELPHRCGLSVGIEPSPMMAQRARARGCLLVRANAERLPIPDAAVSAIVCTYPGPWIRASRVWDELARVTGPDAAVTILLGGSVTRGRFSTVRSRLIQVIYGGDLQHPDNAELVGFGHAQISGRAALVDDAWGQAIVWTGVRERD